MWIAMTCLTLLVAARIVIVRRELAGFEFVGRLKSHGLSLELYRRAMNCKVDGDTQEYPQPREIRMLVIRLAGAPLLCRREAVALPPHYDARLDQLRAEDFDGEFTGQFRTLHRADDREALGLLWHA